MVNAHSHPDPYFGELSGLDQQPDFDKTSNARIPDDTTAFIHHPNLHPDPETEPEPEQLQSDNHKAAPELV